MKFNLPEDIEFTFNHDDSMLKAESEFLNVMVLNDGKNRMFHRAGIKKHMDTGITERKRFLICELDGVRVYVNGGNIVITKQDLYP